MRTQLLCTFTRQSRLNETLDVIISCNKILYNKVYIFNNVNDSSQLICTYNIELIDDFDTNIHNTISLHRKKQTNTLYTINALNELIKSLNNGVLDKRFPIEWNDYRNCILLIQTEGFNKIDTKIREIIKL